MGKKMANAPVYFAIVQVRFNAIMALEDYASKIQEAMRRQGFPDFKRGLKTTINMSPMQSAESAPQNVPFVQTPQYKFSDINQTSGFVLHPEFLVFQTICIYDSM